MSATAKLIEDAVRAVPGVTHVYPVHPEVLVGIGDAHELTVSIGVDAAVPAHETATVVAEAVRALAPDAEVVVRISRVTRD